MSKLLDAAILYASLGWPVFPCKGKKPATRHGVKDATTDPDQIRKWWADDQFNIAIATGQPSGVFVLDIDPGGEESLEDLDIDLPETVEQETGRGRHVFFLTNGRSVKNSAGKLGHGLDIRGDGGYVIVAPSIHPKTRKQYVWEVDHAPDNFEIADPPEALLRLVEKRDEPVTKGAPQSCLSQHNRPYGVTALADEAEKVASAPLGQQEATLNESAFSMGQLIAAGDLTFDTAVDALFEAGMKMANDPAGKPWTEKEVLAKVERGLQDGARAPRKKRQHQREDAEDDDPQATFQLSDVREHEPGEVHWIVEDLIPEGFALLAGRPKLGKSSLVLDVAVNVANGNQVAKAFATEKTGVLYLALEDNLNRIIRRLDAMGVARKDYPANCTVATQWPAGPVGVDKIDAFLTEHPDHKLVLIDTLQHILAPDTEEGYRTTSAELRPLHKLALRHGAAIVGVLHTRKTKAIKDNEFDPLDFDNILGSRAYSAVADAIIMMHRARNEKSGRLAVTGRDISDAIYKAGFDNQRWQFSEINHRVTIRKQVIELFEQHYEAEYSPLEVCQRLGLDPAQHHDAMKQRLRRMEKEGAIERVGYGKYRGFKPEENGKSDTKSDKNSPATGGK